MQSSAPSTSPSVLRPQSYFSSSLRPSSAGLTSSSSASAPSASSSSSTSVKPASFFTSPQRASPTVVRHKLSSPPIRLPSDASATDISFDHINTHHSVSTSLNSSVQDFSISRPHSSGSVSNRYSDIDSDDESHRGSNNSSFSAMPTSIRVETKVKSKPLVDSIPFHSKSARPSSAHNSSSVSDENVFSQSFAISSVQLPSKHSQSVPSLQLSSRPQTAPPAASTARINTARPASSRANVQSSCATNVS